MTWIFAPEVCRCSMQWHGLHQIKKLFAALQCDKAILNHLASCYSINEEIDLLGKSHNRLIKSKGHEEYVARQHTKNWIRATFEFARQ